MSEDREGNVLSRVSGAAPGMSMRLSNWRFMQPKANIISSAGIILSQDGQSRAKVQ